MQPAPSGDMASFLSFVKTRYDLQVLLREIDMLSSSLYMADNNAYENVLSKDVRSDVASAFRAAKQKQSNFVGFLKALRQVLLDLPEVDITVAVDLPESDLGEIYEWYVTNLRKNAILNFKKDATLIGGAQIAYKGKYHELSLKKELDKALVLPAVAAKQNNEII